MREQWIFAEDENARKTLAAEIQKQAFDTVPIAVVGQFAIPTAYRTAVSGIVAAPVVVMWNAEKR